MKKLREHSAGIDIGAKKIFISVEGKEVRSFETFTSSFREAKDYLITQGVKTVAMEATGVYWIILYEILESAGIDVWLVDGRQTRQVPGRKTDVKDCQWIQQLHSFGLLNRCFVPEQEIKEIRAYQRLREDHIRSASSSVNHMQKALTEMNIRLKEVLSQVHGFSGMAIIDAILRGERHPVNLLSLCHQTVKNNKSEELLKALEGHYTPMGLFALQQAYDTYHFYQKQLVECDKQIELLMEKMNRFKDDENSEKNKKSTKARKPIRHNKPQINNLGEHLLNIFEGKDATILPGFTDYSWMQLYSEVGKDLTKWPTEKHFTSWLGLAPGQHNSGKMRKTKSRKNRPKAGQIFRQLAQSLIESKKIALGAFGRKLKMKRGPGVAVKATARKLSILYWRIMVKGLEYTEKGIQNYEERLKHNQEKWMLNTAKKMGYRVEAIVN